MSERTTSTPLTSQHPVVLFDGVCNLCTGSVQFILKRDPEGRFHFAALQSPSGQELAKAFGIDPAQLDSIVLLEGDRAYVKSDAALEIGRQLAGVAHYAYWLRVAPRPLRDFVYDLIASHRYRWFGQSAYCWMPTPELQARFLN